MFFNIYDENPYKKIKINFKIEDYCLSENFLITFNGLPDNTVNIIELNNMDLIQSYRASGFCLSEDKKYLIINNQKCGFIFYNLEQRFEIGTFLKLKEDNDFIWLINNDKENYFWTNREDLICVQNKNNNLEVDPEARNEYLIKFNNKEKVYENINK